jgi:phosphoglucosamine mutase
MIPTPGVAYLTKTLEADVGFMLTASHNPPQYNGIKLFRSDSLSFTDENQQGVEKIIADKKYTLADWRTLGKAQEIEATNLYLKMLKTVVNLQKTWHVVVDPGCGATFSVAPAALNALGCKTTTLNAQPDGTFPARTSEPTAESLISTKKTVKALQADIGIAFDGDGDRVAFIDREGGFVDFDRVLAAFGAFVLKKTGGGTIVTNVEASMCIETMAQRYNGKVVRSRVGDVYVSEAMAKYQAVFGGEPCGAWIHPQIHWCPDGPLSAVLLLAALEEENKTLHEFIGEVPQYVTLRENIVCKNEQKNKIITEIEKTNTKSFPDFTDFSGVDGVRIALKDGWILIRASGTEPLIRLTVEGESLKAARDIMDRGVATVNEKIGKGSV